MYFYINCIFGRVWERFSGERGPAVCWYLKAFVFARYYIYKFQEHCQAVLYLTFFFFFCSGQSFPSYPASHVLPIQFRTSLAGTYLSCQDLPGGQNPFVGVPMPCAMIFNFNQSRRWFEADMVIAMSPRFLYLASTETCFDY